MSVLLALAYLHVACLPEWTVVRDQALTRQDSVAIAAALGTATPCARFVSAYLRVLLVTAHPRDLDQRTELNTELDAAFRAFPDDPRVFLALAYLRFQQGQAREAGRMISRAQERVANASPPLIARERALMAYMRGRLAQDEWRDWRTFGQLRGMSRGRWFCNGAEGTEAMSLVTFNLACPAVFEDIMDHDFQSLSSMKHDARVRLEEYYREALRHDPAYLPALLSLAAELVFERDWDALTDILNGPPTFPMGQMLRGLAAYRTGRDTIAEQLISSAIAALPLSERQAFLNPDLVMTTAEARAFRALPPAAREQYSAAFWRSREVLFLTDVNERLLEHWARVIEADVVFGDHRISLRGRDTNVGELWIRYGRPLKIRDLAMQNGRGSFWSYGPDPDIVFQRFLTYSQYRVHEDAQGAFVQLRERAPQRYRPDEIASVQPLAGHVTRLRSTNGPTTDLLIVAPYPAGSREGMRIGVAVMDSLFRRVASWRGDPIDNDGMVLEITSLGDGPHNVVVEALDQRSARLFQLRDTLTTGFSGFSVSDLLLLRDISGPASARTRRSLTMTHLYNLEMSSSDSALSLYWEVYDPPVDSSGRARMDITVEVRDAARRPLLARVVRTLGRGLTSEPPVSVIKYEHVGQVFNDRVVNWLTVAADWRRGTYEIAVTVQAPSGGTPIRTARTIVVR